MRNKLGAAFGVIALAMIFATPNEQLLGGEHPAFYMKNFWAQHLTIEGVLTCNAHSTEYEAENNDFECSINYHKIKSVRIAVSRIVKPNYADKAWVEAVTAGIGPPYGFSTNL